MKHATPLFVAPPETASVYLDGVRSNPVTTKLETILKRRLGQRVSLRGRRGSSAFVALLFVLSLAVPLASANAGVAHPLQAVPTTGSSQVGCFNYNGVNDSFIPRTVGSLRIALVQPILTSTPYSQYGRGSFYAFYAREHGVTTNVTTDLDLLSTNVSSGSGFNQGWGLSEGMYRFFTFPMAKSCGLLLGKNVQVLTDIDVSHGALFYTQNHTSKFDVVVLPFSEYVMAEEYLAYEDFVAGGGTLVMMAHSLEYPVTYNATTNMETLVYGHGWAFNGRYAYPIACSSDTYVSACPWARNNTDWIGSNSCMASCFHTYKYNGSVVNNGSVIGKALSTEFGGTVFKSYASHEEDSVTNMTGTSIVSVFVNDSTNLIAAYTHHFRKGLVVCMGVFGDDIMATDRSAEYFLLLGIASGGPGPASNVGGSTTVLPSPAASSSILERASTATPVRPVGTVPAASITIGGLAVVVVVISAIVLRRRQTKPGG
jgi:hypothetical protein